jgi:RNA polymerase sigma-70 factor, ECF subfamily
MTCPGECVSAIPVSGVCYSAPARHASFTVTRRIWNIRTFPSSNFLPEETAHGMITSITETAVPKARDLRDEILVTRFQSGDQDAFRHIMERHSERVRNLVYSMFDAADLVDDLTQEVFIKIFRALPAFRFDAAFTTWLYRITINHCRDEIRRRKLRRMFSLQRLLEAGDKEVTMKTMVEPEEHETREAIQHGLQRLPEKYRLPVILKDMEGHSYEEIADIMQCELGTVKSRLARGRGMLRDYLSPILERD